MGFKVTHSYDKDTNAVFKMLTDKDYLTKKYEALGDKNVSVLEHGEQGGKFVIKTQRDVKANPPGFAKKFLAEWNTVIEVDEWDGSEDVKKGTYSVEVKGAPIKMSGVMTLSPKGGGSENVIDNDIKVGVPLVGGKIAKFLERDTVSCLTADGKFSAEYLGNI